MHTYLVCYNYPKTIFLCHPFFTSLTNTDGQCFALKVKCCRLLDFTGDEIERAVS